MKSFFKSAIFLAIAGIVAKVIGAVYKVPLVGVLGAEGIGVYQLVFPMYTTLLTLSSGGIPQAVSRATAKCAAAGKKGECRRLLTVSLLSLTGIGLIGSILLAACGGVVARAQGNAMAGAAYVALAPSVLLVSVLAALRGWWQGQSNMFPTAVSQLIEQIVKLVAGLWFAAMFLPMGVAYGVAGAALGITLSELLAVLVLGGGLVVRKIRAKKGGGGAETARSAATEARRSAGALLGEIYGSALPISFGSLVMPLLQLIDSVMIVNILVAGGLTASAATSLYGIAGAPVSAIVNLPPVVTSAVAAAAMPRIAASLERGGDASRVTGEAMRYAHVVGLGGCAAIALFAPELLTVLYSGGLTDAQIALASTIMRISAVGVPYVCYMQVVTTYLQAKGRAHVPALNLLVGGALKASLTALLLMTVGIEGSAIATVCAYALTLALDVAACDGLRGLSSSPFYGAIFSVGAACVAGGAARLLPFSSSLVSLAVGVGAFAVVLACALILTRTISFRVLLNFKVKITGYRQ